MLGQFPLRGALKLHNDHEHPQLQLSGEYHSSVLNLKYLSGRAFPAFPVFPFYLE
jgi:hypothetical protein